MAKQAEEAARSGNLRSKFFIGPRIPLGVLNRRAYWVRLFARGDAMMAEKLANDRMSWSLQHVWGSWWSPVIMDDDWLEANMLARDAIDEHIAGYTDYWVSDSNACVICGYPHELQGGPGEVLAINTASWCVEADSWYRKRLNWYMKFNHYGELPMAAFALNEAKKNPVKRVA